MLWKKFHHKWESNIQILDEHCMDNTQGWRLEFIKTKNFQHFSYSEKYINGTLLS